MAKKDSEVASRVASRFLVSVLNPTTRAFWMLWVGASRHKGLPAVDKVKMLAVFEAGLEAGEDEQPLASAWGRHKIRVPSELRAYGESAFESGWETGYWSNR